MHNSIIIKGFRESNLVLASLCLLFAMACLHSCDRGNEYQRLVDEQLRSGIHNDTIFLGVHFGMTYQEYYDHITELGFKGIVSQGADMSVLVEIKDLDVVINKNFNPKYVNDSIQEMHVAYKYATWAPWNKRTTDDNLWWDVSQLLIDEYGKGFIKLESDKAERPALVWVFGNKRISLFQQKETIVECRISNLLKI